MYTLWGRPLGSIHYGVDIIGVDVPALTHYEYAWLE